MIFSHHSRHVCLISNICISVSAEWTVAASRSPTPRRSAGIKTVQGKHQQQQKQQLNQQQKQQIKQQKQEQTKTWQNLIANEKWWEDDEDENEDDEVDIAYKPKQNREDANNNSGR